MLCAASSVALLGTGFSRMTRTCVQEPPKSESNTRETSKMHREGKYHVAAATYQYQVTAKTQTRHTAFYPAHASEEQPKETASSEREKTTRCQRHALLVHARHSTNNVTTTRARRTYRPIGRRPGCPMGRPAPIGRFMEMARPSAAYPIRPRRESCGDRHKRHGQQLLGSSSRCRPPRRHGAYARAIGDGRCTR